jgi:hypothetical protein
MSDLGGVLKTTEDTNRFILRCLSETAADQQTRSQQQLQKKRYTKNSIGKIEIQTDVRASRNSESEVGFSDTNVVRR